MPPPSPSLPPYPCRSTGSIISLLILVIVGIDGLSAPAISPFRAAIVNEVTHCHRHRHCAASSSSSSSTTLFVGRGIDPENRSNVARFIDDDASDTVETTPEDASQPPTPTKDALPPLFSFSALRSMMTWNGPPIQIDDTNLLLYDTILLTNLSVSISFFVAHRLNYLYLPSSLNEGSVLSLCWTVAGLASGSFLYSAVDGHYDPRDENYADKGGPRGAGLLAVSTFVTTCSLRIALALICAVLEHRPVGTGGEELIPLEIPFGLVLMSAWRTLHAEHTVR
jgi:hypothetical protein